MSFPDGSESKESACDAGEPVSISGLGRSLGEENGYTLQYSCLDNSMDREAWRSTVHGVTKSQTWQRPTQKQQQQQTNNSMSEGNYS